MMSHNRQEAELSRVIVLEQGRTVAIGIYNGEKILHIIWRIVTLIFRCVNHLIHS